MNWKHINSIEKNTDGINFIFFFQTQTHNKKEKNQLDLWPNKISSIKNISISPKITYPPHKKTPPLMDWIKKHTKEIGIGLGITAVIGAG